MKCWELCGGIREVRINSQKMSSKASLFVSQRLFIHVTHWMEVFIWGRPRFSHPSVLAFLHLTLWNMIQFQWRILLLLYGLELSMHIWKYVPYWFTTCFHASIFNFQHICNIAFDYKNFKVLVSQYFIRKTYLT